MENCPEYTFKLGDFERGYYDVPNNGSVSGRNRPIRKILGSGWNTSNHPIDIDDSMFIKLPSVSSFKPGTISRMNILIGIIENNEFVPKYRILNSNWATVYYNIVRYKHIYN